MIGENKKNVADYSQALDLRKVYDFAKSGMEQQISYIMADLSNAPYYDKKVKYIDQGASLSIPTSVMSDYEQLMEFKGTVKAVEDEAKAEYGNVNSKYSSVVADKVESLVSVSNYFISVLENEGVKNFADIGLTKEEILAKEMESEFEEEKDIF